ncbi:DUF1481 domain-containing protein [Serratia entomophila]|uniref:DUF1481 domain-containing protein n=1 Tax=Serratia entomophila TaxID=42906 RepID=UPI00217768A5|nr:DUF1481 domain-containing protein [Serratia entomophila]CAI1163045.1 Protein of uncharacterised function (DUF1481) [Serratia entomophila]CAI1168248.1 Protein of uncharacterised function (DUF1481) [Serratia entomophila]CAI1169990.1 Protein of uncharacterised function (DUF1481) [Serratia entomophila]CAI1172788.1 Protein of uncharacterised function (DUF1481) [Serratia entomophila]CAI1984769.1 Protein of uncharacterised function (DUF1481) [Serratia entomophila]
MAPLLFIRRALVVVGIAVSLGACSFHSDIPSFTASGYVADQGVIRLWRKDDEQHRAQVLMSVYSPYRGPGTVTTLYTYQGGILRQIKRTDADGDRDSIQLRFADDGTVSFMQRQLATRREQLSSDEIALYQYQARRILEVSDALRAGQVKLLQGRWLRGEVQTCDGQRLKPGLSANAEAWVEKRARNSSQPVNIAWLDAPEGRALLLVANDDFCSWEPKENQL